MTAAAGSVARPDGAFEHDALLYAGAEQFVRHTAAVVRDALDRDEPILVAVIEPRASLLREELGGDAKRVEFLDMWAVGRNPARIIPAWQQWVERHAGSGRGFHGIGEPIWAGRTQAELVECQQHEQLLNTAFDDGPAWRLLCPYDTESLPEHVIRRAHDTHPGLLDGAGLRRSAHYPSRELAHPAMFADALPEPDPSCVLYQADFGLGELARVRAAVAGYAATLGLNARRAADLVLVANELATNSVRHGGGHGTLRLWRDGNDAVCEVRDQGRVHDPLIGRRRPDPTADTGAGLWIANQLCDLVQIRSTPEPRAIVRVRIDTAAG